MSAEDLASLTITTKEDDRKLILQYVNHIFKNDASTKSTIPVDPSNMDSVKKIVSDGIVIGKMMQMAKPSSISEGALNTGGKKTAFQVNANLQAVLDGLRDVGLRGYENLKPDDLGEPEEKLVLELTEKILKLVLFKDISQKKFAGVLDLKGLTPNLSMSAAPAAKTSQFKVAKKMPVEDIMVMWFNQHVRAFGYNALVKSVGDISVKAWAHFTYSLDPKNIKMNLSLSDDDLAKWVIATLTELDRCHFLSESVILDKNARMITYFIATQMSELPLFSNFYADSLDKIFAMTDKKEAAYAQWILTMPGFNTDDVYASLKDGVSIFHIIDYAKPGKADWKRVNKGKLNPFKAAGNWKLANETICGLVRFPPSVEDSNLAQGDIEKIKLLVDVLLEEYTKEHSAIPDDELLKWANEVLVAGKKPEIKSLKDESLKTIIPLANVLQAIAPKCIDDSKLKGDAAEAAKYLLKASFQLGVHSMVTVDDLVAGKVTAVKCYLGDVKSVLERK